MIALQARVIFNKALRHRWKHIHSQNCWNIWLPGRARVLFEPGNVDELAGIMSDVYAGRIDADKLIHNGTAGLSRFAPDSIIPQITKLIKDAK